MNKPILLSPESPPAIGKMPAAPLKPDEEWANALSHGIATAASCVLTVWLVWQASQVGPGIALASAAYGATVIGTFLSSTLSHSIHRQPWLNRFRAWDQAMIYLMITGTYTPIIAAHAPPLIRFWLLPAIWIAALMGFASKVALLHRVNSISTVSYLLLGWLPAIPLYGHVPATLGLGMLAGGVMYSIGVIFLMNDQRVRYFHVTWHGFVMMAALIHYRVILHNCVLGVLESSFV